MIVDPEHFDADPDPPSPETLKTVVERRGVKKQNKYGTGTEKVGRYRTYRYNSIFFNLMINCI